MSDTSNSEGEEELINKNYDNCIIKNHEDESSSGANSSNDEALPPSCSSSNLYEETSQNASADLTHQLTVEDVSQKVEPIDLFTLSWGLIQTLKDILQTQLKNPVTRELGHIADLLQALLQNNYASFNISEIKVVEGVLFTKENKRTDNICAALQTSQETKSIDVKRQPRKSKTPKKKVSFSAIEILHDSKQKRKNVTNSGTSMKNSALRYSNRSQLRDICDDSDSDEDFIPPNEQTKTPVQQAAKKKKMSKKNTHSSVDSTTEAIVHSPQIPSTSKEELLDRTTKTNKTIIKKGKGKTKLIESVKSSARKGKITVLEDTSFVNLDIDDNTDAIVHSADLPPIESSKNTSREKHLNAIVELLSASQRSQTLSKQGKRNSDSVKASSKKGLGRNKSVNDFDDTDDEITLDPMQEEAKPSEEKMKKVRKHLLVQEQKLEESQERDLNSESLNSTTRTLPRRKTQSIEKTDVINTSPRKVIGRNKSITYFDDTDDEFTVDPMQEERKSPEKKKKSNKTLPVQEQNLNESQIVTRGLNKSLNSTTRSSSRQRAQTIGTAESVKPTPKKVLGRGKSIKDYFDDINDESTVDSRQEEKKSPEKKMKRNNTLPVQVQKLYDDNESTLTHLDESQIANRHMNKSLNTTKRKSPRKIVQAIEENPRINGKQSTSYLTPNLYPKRGKKPAKTHSLPTEINFQDGTGSDSSVSLKKYDLSTGKPRYQKKQKDEEDNISSDALSKNQIDSNKRKPSNLECPNNKKAKKSSPNKPSAESTPRFPNSRRSLYSPEAWLDSFRAIEQ